MALSGIISGVLAIMVIGTLCAAAMYQVVKGQPVSIPPFLEGIAGVIVGYFFSHQTAATTANNIVNGLNASHDSPVPVSVVPAAVAPTAPKPGA